MSWGRKGSDFSTLFSIREVCEADCRCIHVEGAIDRVVIVPLVPVVIYVVLRSGIEKWSREPGSCAL